MSEIKAIRLPKAATTYNVSTDHIVEELRKNGFTIENNPNAKITPEMVMALEKAFNKDKAIKELQADNTKMVEKPKKETLELKEEIPITAAKKLDDEKEVIIKSNIVSKEAEVKAPAKVEEPVAEKMEREAPKLEGPKVVGKVDLDKPKENSCQEKSRRRAGGSNCLRRKKWHL